ncbi:MAG TPA: HAMP domain-containing sensor histidine kinase [Ohtaekwangia sp.]|uniref:sensor histidine kinase n=1 Tax=Ohtaekwangia sp. TaxID=2066019 RepID=UPI002F93764A
MIKKIESLLVGDRGEKSLSDYRRAVLTGYSILITIATSAYYIILNWFYRYNPSAYLYYILIAVLLVAMVLNKAGRHWFAKCIVLSILDLVVFAFSSREPPVPSSFIFFIMSSLMALILFDAREKKSTAVFLLLSTSLYFIARYSTFSLVQATPIDEQYMVRAYNNNLFIVYAFSILAVYFLVRINYTVEASLQNREKQILEKNKILTKTNEELDRFIYSTSHDLRAPLNSIEGLINLSEHTTDPEDLRTYHQMMRDRIRKLENVLTNISQYSKNAKLEVEKKHINLREYVNLALYDIRYMEAANRVRVEVDIPDNLTIDTDPMRLSIILNNLISNACKYSDQGKTDPYVAIRAIVTPPKTTITISDNGEGIDEVQQPRIFSMFYRGTTRSTGSGLGLYLVKEAVEKLGGTITLSSVPGQGATFTVVL